MMRAELETEVLKGVSRSFYLSLRLLPGPMRRAAGIAYLLARTSDTLADSVTASTEERIAALQQYLEQVRGEQPPSPIAEEFLTGLTDPREAVLLLSHLEILQALRRLEAGEISLIQEVLETIVSGQILDIERFGQEGTTLTALKSDAELDDYTFRVAGCVGLFWTRLGFHTMGENFSSHPQAELEQWGVDYGKGLQLVNILRDFQTDRRMGRCYLPVADPQDDAVCLEEFRKWRQVAIQQTLCGRAYVEKLSSRRLRLASGLPAEIAQETLKRLDIRTLAALEPRVKVSRNRLYWLIFRQCLEF